MAGTELIDRKLGHQWLSLCRGDATSEHITRNSS